MIIPSITTTFTDFVDIPTITNPGKPFGLKSEKWLNIELPRYQNEQNQIIVEMNASIAGMNSLISDTTTIYDDTLALKNATQVIKDDTQGIYDDTVIVYGNTVTKYDETVVTYNDTVDVYDDTVIIKNNTQTIYNDANNLYLLMQQLGIVAEWISGTSYSYPDVVTDPTTFQNYRAKTLIASSTIEPHLDTANWEQITGLTAVLVIDGGRANENYTNTITISGGDAYGN